MTKNRRKILSLLLLLSVLPGGQDWCAYSQQLSEERIEDIRITLVVKEKIGDFITTLDNFEDDILNAPPEVYPDLNMKFNSINVRWNTYYQSYLGFIADHEDLMESVSEYEALRDKIQISLDELKAKMAALEDFKKAEHFLKSQDSLYLDIYKKAQSLSATSKLAGKLEALKGREQLIFAEIQEKFDAASAATELLPSLSSRMEALNNEYVTLKCLSEKIQEAAYKPLMQRVKDYLLSFAAVALLLMFASMVQSKLKAAKQLKENAKKMLDKLNNGKDDIPSI